MPPLNMNIIILRKLEQHILDDFFFITLLKKEQNVLV